MIPASGARILVSLAAILASVGCATGRGSLDDLPVETFVGHHTAPSGQSWFIPCGAAESVAPLWVTFTGEAVARRDTYRSRSTADPAEPFFVRWRASVTTAGEVGPGGPALLVREVLEMRPAAAGDCDGDGSDARE